MANTEAGRQFLDQLVDDQRVNFSAEDREALLRAGVPIGCILKCAARLVTCGVTNPQCVGEFVACVIGCLGRGGGGTV